MAEDERQRLLRIQPNLARRALIFQFVRNFFTGQGFLEVETPIRVPTVAPEANIVPFESEGWFLSTSPELYMKRLLAAGYQRLFQLSHCFRQNERGRHHNPEFTLLEWYRAGNDYQQMIIDTEALVMSLVTWLEFKPIIQYQHQNIDLTPPWPRITVRDAFLSAAGWDPVIRSDSLRFDVDLVTRVIPAFPLDRPVVLLDYPVEMASLARRKPGQPEIAERAEVFIAGLELANAYSELTSREEQERRFSKEIERIQREQGRRPIMPQPFLTAMSHLPDCSGIALGMDRLVMLFCDAGSIDEVIPFTTDTA